MGIVVEAKEGNYTVLVEDDMTIYDAVAQKTKLLSALKKLKKNGQMEVNLSEVNEMDTAGLQVLILLKRTAEKEKKTLLLLAHSSASLDVIDRYNLATYFGDPVIFSSTNSRK